MAEVIAELFLYADLREAEARRWPAKAGMLLYMARLAREAAQETWWEAAGEPPPVPEPLAAVRRQFRS